MLLGAGLGREITLGISIGALVDKITIDGKVVRRVVSGSTGFWVGRVVEVAGLQIEVAFICTALKALKAWSFKIEGEVLASEGSGDVPWAGVAAKSTARPEGNGQ